MPLVRSWWLGKKKGKEAWVRPSSWPIPIIRAASGFEFEIGHGVGGARRRRRRDHVGRQARPASRAERRSSSTYIDARGARQAAGQRADGRRRRGQPPAHLPRADRRTQARRRRSAAADDAGPASLAIEPRGFSTPALRVDAVRRPVHEPQLLALTTFSDLVIEARERVLTTPSRQACPRRPARIGGTGAEAYADAVATYLGSLSAARRSTNRRWATGQHRADGESAQHVRASGNPDGLGLRGGNPFADCSGSLDRRLDCGRKALELLASLDRSASVQQARRRSRR